VLDDFSFNRNTLAIYFEMTPSTWSEIKHLEYMFAVISTRNLKQDAPFNQVTVIAVPLVSHELSLLRVVDLGALEGVAGVDVDGLSNRSYVEEVNAFL
jgi:hypothetical protein